MNTADNNSDPEVPPSGEAAGAGRGWRGHIVYRMEESSSADGYQAVCPELDITAFGDTPAAARRALRSHISMYLEDCDDLGVLDEVLIEAGFYFGGDTWISNEVVPVKDPDIVIL